ncbi:MAG: hypothetical protein GX595_00405 [Lentisphaerae bacterium]|nr:hypothetical protein [Lentisphaerota bacterium]
MQHTALSLALAGLALFGQAAARAQAAPTPGGWVDHGVGVPLAEGRGAVTVRDGHGRNLVIGCALDSSPRGWILVTDIDSGQSTQVFCPEGVANSPPYGSLIASSGRFYTAQGAVFLEFDPSAGAWTFHGRPAQGTAAFLRIVEAPDGTIWMGGVYQAGLASFDPRTRTLRDHGRLDDKEQYLSTLAIDDAGWVYGGIGTARCNVVAYHPPTGERRQIVPEDRRKVGGGSVYRGVDGRVYAKATLTDGAVCWRLTAGVAEEIPASAAAKAAPNGEIGWGDRRGSFPDGRVLKAYSLEDKTMEILDPASGQTRRITLEYQSEGTALRVLGLGPDGKVWANSAHPSRGMSYDPADGTLRHYPGAIAMKGLAVQGRHLFGGHYTGGRLYVFDSTLPWDLDPKAPPALAGLRGADLKAAARSDDGELHLLGDLGLVLFKADAAGGEMHVDLETAEDGEHWLAIEPWQSPGYGTVEFLLDGKAIGAPYRGTNPAIQPGPRQTFGPLTLAAGRHRLGIRTLATPEGNPWIGIRTVALTRAAPPAATPAAGNPRVAGTFAPDINVPWGACAHPDGRHIMISGNPGYGYLGGGIGIHNLETGENTLLTHEQLVPNQCIMAMVALDNGDLVCASSTAGGHGSNRVANEAQLIILDWQRKAVVFREAVAPGAAEIGLLCRGRDGLVYAFAEGLVVFDPAQRRVVHTADLSAHGRRTVNGMALGPDGFVYVVMTKGVVRVAPAAAGFALEAVAAAPPGGITAGTAIAAGRLYVACNSHLWSVPLPSAAPQPNQVPAKP